MTGPEGNDLPVAQNHDCVTLPTMLVEVMSNRRLHRPLPRQVTRQDLGLNRRCVDYLGLAHGFSFPSLDLEVALDLARSLSNIVESSTSSAWRSPLAISTGPPASLS